LVAVNAALGSMQAPTIQTTPLSNCTALDSFEDSALRKFVVNSLTIHSYNRRGKKY